MSVASVCVVCWSAKGGSGTSVIAAALALRSADFGRETLLVDLDGDQPDVLGVTSEGPGATDWLAAGDDVPVDALAGLEVPVTSHLMPGDIFPGRMDREPQARRWGGHVDNADLDRAGAGYPVVRLVADGQAHPRGACRDGS